MSFSHSRPRTTTYRHHCPFRVHSLIHDNIQTPSSLSRPHSTFLFPSLSLTPLFDRHSFFLCFFQMINPPTLYFFYHFYRSNYGLHLSSIFFIPVSVPSVIILKL
ncbi:hypothetical protein F5H01DRAFT_355777, partial [Linnemannia elongata]